MSKQALDQPNLTKEVVSGGRSDPGTRVELTQFNGNSSLILAFNDETSQFPL